MCRPKRLLSTLVVSALLWAPICYGQWSGDPAANLVIADRSGPQVQAKIVPTADGGFYLSWFDNATGGYDVYLQRLDAAGVEQWPHNGVLVADRSHSWTMYYGQRRIHTGGGRGFRSRLDIAATAGLVRLVSINLRSCFRT